VRRKVGKKMLVETGQEKGRGEEKRRGVLKQFSKNNYSSSLQQQKELTLANVKSQYLGEGSWREGAGFRGQKRASSCREKKTIANSTIPIKEKIPRHETTD